MKPAGPERDRAICWIRLKKYHIEDRRPRCPKCSPECDMVSPYSTDISVAMDLAMPEGQSRLDVYHGLDGYYANLLLLSAKENVALTFESDVHPDESTAITDARSGAWLKWKEGK